MTEINWNEEHAKALELMAERLETMCKSYLCEWQHAYRSAAKELRMEAVKLRSNERRPNEHMPLFQTEQGEEIERLTAELVEATEMALGQAKTLIEKDKRIAELENAARDMVRIVETIEGALNHGTWVDSAGRRLKDTSEWVALYLAARLREGEK